MPHHSDQDDRMSGEVMGDDDLDQVPPEATSITLLRTDMASLSVDEPLLDYDDLKVKPVASDCMSSSISFVSRIVSNVTHNRCQSLHERAWRSDSHLRGPVRLRGPRNFYV
jgi:hypothetical protein